jgi:hypothetical protein
MAGLACPRIAPAQAVEVSAYGLAASNAEVDRTRQARGLGLGAAMAIDFGRWRLDVEGRTASLRADFTVQPDYAVDELSVLGTYRWRPALELQLGAGRRFTRPDLMAQEVGIVRVGLRSEVPLSSLGRIHARAAYLPVTRFSGGGNVGLALECGFGVSVGPFLQRLTGLVDYTYQRVDRRVDGAAVPIRYSAVRLGVATRW